MNCCACFICPYLYLLGHSIAKCPDSFPQDYGGPKIVDLSDRWFDEKRSFIMPDCFLNRSNEVGIISDNDEFDKLFDCLSDYAKIKVIEKSTNELRKKQAA